MKKSIIPVVAVLALASVGVTFHNSDANCIEVYTDFGPLADGKVSSQCIVASGEMSAFDVLKQAGYTTEGTQEYGDAVLCRLNGLPDALVESCVSMPPAEAYWAVLIKEHEVVPIPFNTAGEWGWAQVGINEVTLKPGDSIGLVFSDENGDVKFP